MTTPAEPKPWLAVSADELAYRATSPARADPLARSRLAQLRQSPTARMATQEGPAPRSTTEARMSEKYAALLVEFLTTVPGYTPTFRAAVISAAAHAHYVAANNATEPLPEAAVITWADRSDDCVAFLLGDPGTPPERRAEALWFAAANAGLRSELDLRAAFVEDLVKLPRPSSITPEMAREVGARWEPQAPGLP